MTLRVLILIIFYLQFWLKVCTKEDHKQADYDKTVIVMVGPRDVVVSYPGGSATFDCISFSTETVDVHFLVNGSLFDSLTLKNVTQEVLLNNMGQAQAGILRFEDLPVEYNNTRIQCRAELSIGSFVTSVVYTLLLQG